MQATEKTAFSTRSTSRATKSLVKVGVIRGFVREPLDEEKEKAFNITSQRFTYKKEQVDSKLPGPGQYELYSQSIWRDNKASNSRKGYGMLQSKVFRNKKFSKLLHTGPGPGQYTPSQSREEASELHPSRATAGSLTQRGHRIPRAASSTLIRPTTSERVGPGSYDLDLWKKSAPHNNAGVAFKSKSQRAEINEGIAGLGAPSSTRYNIKRGLLAEKPLSLKGMSSFCPPQPARTIKPHEYDKIMESITSARPATRSIQFATLAASPGPGDYEVEEGFKRLADSHCTSTKQVFGAASKGQSFIQTNKYPGPGHYQIDSKFDSLKFLAYNSPFMSQTERKAFDIRPPPSIFAPFTPVMIASKKTFNINKGKKWI